MNDQPSPLDLDPRSTDSDDRFDVTGNTWHGSVLLADEIDQYCNANPSMIEPYERNRLRPASYQLTLGDCIHLGGEEQVLKLGETVTLPAHQVAVVSTRETIRVPRFLIGRWSLRVEKIYEGLLWTGGPQVDPGWEGQLYCPIYNLADRPVQLRVGDPMFTIDFTRTTGLTDQYRAMPQEPNLEKTWFSPVRRTLAEHDKHRIRSAPYERLRELQELSQFRAFGYAAVGVLFVALSAVTAALAVLAVSPTIEPDGPLLSFWPMTALMGSAAAFVVSIGTLIYVWKIGLRNRL